MRNEQIDYTLFKAATKEFHEHLSVENNDRIVFSGKFGHGKTTFLKYFFNKKEYSEKYQPFYLYPVNYSVASNEDIFEYIKYDILIEMLLSEQYTFDHIEITKWQSLSFYLAKAPEKIIQAILGMMSKTGNTEAVITEAFANSIVNLSKTLEEINQRDKEDLSEVIKVKNLLSKIESKEGSIYESNAITEIIKNALSNQTDRKKVLIIDDLDRIDPEHIFRILNVFAAHLDTKQNQPNKFGFDKVILVCDIENIRNIFRAKYGIRTDFNGYIDKYYSHKIFNYDIRDYMFEYAGSILETSKIAGNVSEARRSNWQRLRNEVFTDLFRDVFKLLIDIGEIDMRNIIKWRDMPVTYHSFARIEYISRYNDRHRSILLGIRMLIDIKGSSGALKKAVDDIKLISPLHDNYRAYCNELAYIYLLPIHKNEFRKTPNTNRFLANINGSNLYFQLGDTDDYGIDENHLMNTSDFIFLLNNVIDMIANRQIIFIG